MTAALLLTDLICGKKSPYESLFAPSRFHWRSSSRELSVHLLESSKGLLSGFLHKAPRCPHMGCQLEWNPADDAWECPCHGSRFDQHGHLKNGPAQTPLSDHRL